MEDVILVVDNSQDIARREIKEYARCSGTSDLSTAITSTANDYENDNRSEDNNNEKNYFMKVIHRANNYGLIFTILEGIHSSDEEYILVIDAHFSRLPEVIPEMIDKIQDSEYDVIIGSAYTKGSSIIDWSFRRQLISRGATRIAQYELKIRTEDPISGFFVCNHHLLQHINTQAYKILLEILVKKPEIKVKGIRYTLVSKKNRRKMVTSRISDYLKDVWILYRYGCTPRQALQLRDIQKSISTFSRVARFCTMGGIGPLANYFISSSLANGLLANISCMNATLVGVKCSITSNLLLKEKWTFEEDIGGERALPSKFLF